jgi:adenosine kinase
VITCGSEATVVASSAPGSVVRVYPVEKLDAECIVDTNGAGDCFAGGFVGALVRGKSLDDAVKVGHKLGTMCVGQVCVFDFILFYQEQAMNCALGGTHARVA